MIKTQLQLATVFFFILVPRGYKVKMPACTLSLSKLLHDEHSKHIMEVAVKNMKTDLQLYNKTLP